MRRLKMLALFGLVLLLAAATSEAALQPNQPRLRRLDHFWCYDIVTADPDAPLPSVDAPVLLQDQFDIAAGAFEYMIVRTPIQFCNPVAKRHNNRVTPIGDRDAHLEFYKIEPAPANEPVPEQQRLVVFSNQFQRTGAAVLGKPTMLAVPTQKVRPGNHRPPRRLDHFKCYDVLKFKPFGAEELTVALRDQFQSGEPAVKALMYFCNPTRKIRTDADGNVAEVTGVQNARYHLACYDAIWNGEMADPVGVHNQFSPRDEVESINVGNTHLLCVPTVKHHLGEAGSLTDILPGDD